MTGLRHNGRPLKALLAGLGAGVSVFVIDLLAGLVARGIDLEHLSNIKHAGYAGIAAVLAAVGVGGAVAGGLGDPRDPPAPAP
jgi:hypothetical protein